MPDHDEREPELVPPTGDRVVRRAFCLSSVICRSFIDEPSGVNPYEALNSRIRPWLAAVGAESELESWESAALLQPLGHLTAQTRLNGSWISEGLAVIAWALQRYELPAHDTCVDPQAVTNALGFLQPNALALFSDTSLRSAAEIQLYAQRAFVTHWRLRQFSLTPAHMDFADFARTAWFGPFDIEGVALADGDLSIGGAPIAKAPGDALQIASSIALERHRAFNWLIGYDEVYSEVDTST